MIEVIFGREIRNELDIFYNAAYYTDSFDGDYFEFGVYRGKSFINAYYAFQNARNDFHKSRKDLNLKQRDKIINSRFFAFDSFQGLPQINDIDHKGPFTQGQFKATKDEFIENCKKFSINMDKVFIIEGYYDESLNESLYEKFKMDKLRVVHIDCDLYESTKTVLNFITPLIQNGTVIIFDDWFQFQGNPVKGEQKAFNEWVLEQDIYFSEFMKKTPWKNSFIVGKK